MTALLAKLRTMLGFDAADAGHWFDTEPWVRLGVRFLVITVGGLLVLSVVVSVSGAVVATGRVGIEGNVKAIQHLDGGVVAEILVRDGDRVDAGQPLLRLDATAARASRDATQAKIDEFAIQRARLEAERDGAADFGWPEPLTARRAEPAVARAWASQRAVFAARQSAHAGERAMLTERIEQAKGELRGLKALSTARRQESMINAGEVTSLVPLQQRGIVSQQRMAPLMREKARLEGDVGRLEAEVARTEGAMAEARLKLQQSAKDLIQAVVEDLRKVEAALTELEESQKTLEQKLARTLIRAPDPGRVHALAVHTVGGVVTPAATLLQIVPESAPLSIEAQLTPHDIDKVREGQAAAVRFPAFDARTTPRLQGRVVRVSPAQLTDPQGRAYFLAEIELSREERARIGQRHKLLPGMPAEVFIETGTRSLLSYFVKPLTDAVTRAFRES